MCEASAGDAIVTQPVRNASVVQLDEPLKAAGTRPPSVANRLGRFAFVVVWLLLARPTPPALHAWRRMLLRLFGAKIGRGAAIYGSAKVWAPWNLIMEPGACLAREVNCYNVAVVTLKRGCVVSQGAHLCSATHDFRAAGFPLTSAPIIVGEDAWVAAEAFVGPGVTIGKRAVLGARAVAVKGVPAATIAAGNPARIIGRRDDQLG